MAGSVHRFADKMASGACPRLRWKSLSTILTAAELVFLSAPAGAGLVAIRGRSWGFYPEVDHPGKAAVVGNYHPVAHKPFISALRPGTRAVNAKFLGLAVP